MTSLKVNGQLRAVEADAEKPLLWVLREDLGLTGTKFGCGVGACGACTVHVNGEPVRSCSLPLGAAAGAEIVTIEGLAASAGIAGWRPASGAARLDRRAGPAVRLLPVGHDHGRGGAAAEDAQADRRRDRRRHRQPVPLWHLSAGAPRDPRPRAEQGVREGRP